MPTAAAKETRRRKTRSQLRREEGERILSARWPEARVITRPAADGY
jgi:hypothetical protein